MNNKFVESMKNSYLESARKEEEKQAGLNPQQKMMDNFVYGFFGVIVLVCLGFAVVRQFTPESCQSYSSRTHDTLGETIDSQAEIDYASRAIQVRPECF